MKRPFPDIKKAIPIILAFLFLFLAIYILLVVLRWSPFITFLIAFPGALAVMVGGEKLIKVLEKSKIFKSRLFTIIVISVCVLALLTIFLNVYLDLRVGYKKGDYSEHECSLCSYPADGGVFVSGREISDYYCEHHFDWVKKRAEEIGKNPTQSEIWFEAERIVKNKLKAPETAEFCPMSQATIKQVGDTWMVKGYVDAENSFGAKIRNDFKVIITFTSNTQYTIDECSITIR